MHVHMYCLREPSTSCMAKCMPEDMSARLVWPIRGWVGVQVGVGEGKALQAHMCASTATCQRPPAHICPLRPFLAIATPAGFNGKNEFRCSESKRAKERRRLFCHAIQYKNRRNVSAVYEFPKCFGGPRILYRQLRIPETFRQSSWLIP